jgi:TfoX/Sxy family transcriptional regulator of competence genes
MEKPSPEAVALFEEVAEDLRTRHGGVTTGPMFGSPSLKLQGKVIASVYGDTMVFKLEGDDYAQALALPGAQLFDPMGGRPMKAWVQVPSAQAAEWDDLAERAYVRLAAELGVEA